MRRAEAGAVSDTAVSRKARNRLAGGRTPERRNGKALETGSSGDESKAELWDESPVHITARTDDGRTRHVPDTTRSVTGTTTSVSTTATP